MLRGAAIAVVLLATAGLVAALVDLPTGAPSLVGDVQARLDDSGVSQPVTAVLLNFRGYDTLLEVAVMLLAVVGAFAVSGEERLRPAGEGDPGAVLVGLARMMAAPFVLVGAYLLWLGTSAPGGAFQAAAVLASTSVLLRLSGFTTLEWLRPGVLRGLLVAGLLLFLAVAVEGLVAREELLAYPRGGAGALILAIEIGATLSIGAALAALFARADPGHGERGRAGR